MIMLKSQQTLQQKPAVWKWVPGLTQPQPFTCTLPPPSPGSRAGQKVGVHLIQELVMPGRLLHSSCKASSAIGVQEQSTDISTPTLSAEWFN